MKFAEKGEYELELSDINIRQARESDIVYIAQIKVSGWRDTYKNIIDSEYLDLMNVSQQIDIIKKSYFLDNIFVAEINNKILAFCRMDNCSRFVCDNKKIDCEIREIYVRPDLKRNGIGSQLFNYVLNYAKQDGKKYLYLSCFEKNYNSRNFYEKMQGIPKAENSMEINGKTYPTISYLYCLND